MISNNTMSTVFKYAKYICPIICATYYCIYNDIVFNQSHNTYKCNSPNDCFDFIKKTVRSIDDFRSIDEVPEKYMTPKICKYVIERDSLLIWNLPEKHITYEMCQTAIKLKPVSISHIPIKYQTYKMYLYAVEQDAEIIARVPTEHKTYEICAYAVGKNGLLLKYLLEKYFNPKTLDVYDGLEIFMIAVKQNGLALQFLLKYQDDLKYEYIRKMREIDYVNDRIQLDNKNIKFNDFMRNNIPMSINMYMHETENEFVELAKHYLEKIMLEKSIYDNNNELKNVERESKELQHKKEKMQNICLEAVKQNPLALEYVSEYYQTFEMCLMAFQKDKTTYKFIKDTRMRLYIGYIYGYIYNK